MAALIKEMEGVVEDHQEHIQLAAADTDSGNKARRVAAASCHIYILFR